MRIRCGNWTEWRVPVKKEHETAVIGGEEQGHGPGSIRRWGSGAGLIQCARAAPLDLPSK
jgi:hypothetical protein